MVRLLSVILVCLYGMCLCFCAQSASKVALPRDYGVKLCGREFIRAVIFTCGGSRWKRSLDLDLSQSSEQNQFLLGSYIDPSESKGELGWSQSPGDSVSEPSSSLYSLPSLSELLQAMAEQGQVGAEMNPNLQRQRAGELFTSTSLVGEQARSPFINWPRPNRRKRNFSVGVAGMCCNQGCTKNDIGRLC